jgi:phage-related protein
MSLNQSSTILEGYVDNNTINTVPTTSKWARFTNIPIINMLIYIFSLIGTAIKYMFKGIGEFLGFLSPVFELLFWFLIFL